MVYLVLFLYINYFSDYKKESNNHLFQM